MKIINNSKLVHSSKMELTQEQQLIFHKSEIEQLSEKLFYIENSMMRSEIVPPSLQAEYTAIKHYISEIELKIKELESILQCKNS